MYRKEGPDNCGPCCAERGSQKSKGVIGEALFTHAIKLKRVLKVNFNSLQHPEVNSSAIFKNKEAFQHSSYITNSQERKLIASTIYTHGCVEASDGDTRGRNTPQIASQITSSLQMRLQILPNPNFHPRIHTSSPPPRSLLRRRSPAYPYRKTWWSLLLPLGLVGIPHRQAPFPPEHQGWFLRRPFPHWVLQWLGLHLYTSPSLILFNPSTRFHKEVIYGRNRSLLGSGTKYGFGFDDINHDYKVVRLTAAHPLDLGLYKSAAISQVEVYSFKSGYWNVIEGPYDQDLMMRMETGALIDNHLLHWSFWDVSNGRFRIGCFDLRNNRWSDVPLPNNCLENGSDRDGGGHCGDHSDELIVLAYFGVFDGCLCLLTKNLHRIGEYDLWVMEEYGVKESWVKLVHISLADVLLGTQISPLVYAKGSRNELLILRKDSRSKIFWYNIRDKTCRLASIHGVPPYTMACICKGSLVGIPRCVFFQQSMKSPGKEWMQA